MESTYINTGHPDFISGHKALAIVSDRMSAAKGPAPVADPKTGKLPPGTLNNGRDLESDVAKKEEGFFGSFWPGGKKPMTPKKSGTLEPVSLFRKCAHHDFSSFVELTSFPVTPAAPSSFARFRNSLGARDDGN